jgi:hypothetical protein
MNDDEARDEFDAITSGQEMSRMARLLKGELRVEDLDDEELFRGQCRDRRGGFSGGKPDMIPRAMMVEWSRRIRQGATTKLDANLGAMTDALVSLITHESTDSAVRLSAIKYGMDRVLGKAVERLDLQVSEKPWESLLSIDGGIFRRIDEEPRVPAPNEIESGE